MLLQSTPLYRSLSLSSSYISCSRAKLFLGWLQVMGDVLGSVEGQLETAGDNSHVKSYNITDIIALTWMERILATKAGNNI